MAGRFNREKLYWLRKERGWSQEKAAEQCGGDSFQDFLRTYLRMENKDGYMPRKSSMAKLCHGFGLNSPDELLLAPGKCSEKLHELAYNSRGNRFPVCDEIIKRPEGKFIVAMDADNTFLRGFEFSWKEVWRYLGYDDEARSAAMKKYLRGELDYSSWCIYCLDRFTDKGLNKAAFKEIVRPFNVVENFRKGIKQLKKNGAIVIMVSGGIDTFVEAMLPDYKELFDHAAINRLHFNSAGNLQSVSPTLYDFEGKAQYLVEWQERYGIPTSRTYFIGEGLNDRSAAKVSGTSIAWNPKDQMVEQLFDVVIRGDDFMDIVNRICPEASSEE